MRAFVAVNIEENLRRAVAEAQERLRATGADVKWVRPEGVHITLKFLGWVEQVRVSALVEALRATLEHQEPFTVRLEGIGGFPSATAPRVVWVGVSGGAAELSELAQRTEDALEPLGFAREQRPFSPHLTIGRCRSPRGRQELTAAMREERDRVLGEMRVERVELMRSELRPEGAIYTSQFQFGLRGASAQGER